MAQEINPTGGFYSNLGAIGSPYPNQASMFTDIPMPTSTEAGAAVWEQAKRLAVKYHDLSAAQAVRRAMDIVGVGAFEMTQEDIRCIEMGLEVIISHRASAPQPPTLSGMGVNSYPGEKSSQGGFLR